VGGTQDIVDNVMEWIIRGIITIGHVAGGIAGLNFPGGGESGETMVQLNLNAFLSP
jgi:hypothetical protein